MKSNVAADLPPPILPIEKLDFSSRLLALCCVVERRHKNRFLIKSVGNDAIEKIDAQL